MRGLTAVERMILEDASYEFDDEAYALPGGPEEDFSPEESFAVEALRARGLIVPDPKSLGDDQFWNITARGRLALRVCSTEGKWR